MFDGSFLGRFTRYVVAALLLLVVLLVLGEVVVRLLGHGAGRTLPELAFDMAAQSVQPTARPLMEVDRRGYWVAREGVAGVGSEGLRIAQPGVEQDGAPVIVLLGADLAWGSDDAPAATAAGILGEAGYVVHNLATPRAPHSQWPLLLNSYVERLRPHAVIALVDVARDFEAPVAVTPQQSPYYETNVGFLPAIDREGNRLTFTQAVNEYERRISGHYPMLQSLAEHSALAYLWVDRLTFGGMATWDVGALVESLELARMRAEKQGAEFMVALVGKAPTQAFAAQQNARAQAVLGSFEPAYFARPDVTVTVRREQTQRRLAPWLASLLKERQLPPPRPKVLERYQRSAHEGISWEMWADALSLDEEQGDAILGMVNGLKDEVTQLFRQPSAERKVAPLQLMADQARGGSAATLEAFIQEARPENGGDTYGDLVAQYESEARSEIIEVLDVQQRVAFAELDFGALMSIETGYDPLGDAVRNMLMQGPEGDPEGIPTSLEASLSFEAFSVHLGLNDGEREAARAILDGLKDDFLGVLSRRTNTGEASPLEHVASRLRDEGADAEAALSAYMARHLDSATDRPYTDALLANEEKAREALLGLVGEDRMAALFSLPIAALMHVDTGYDPMGAWLEERYREVMAQGASQAEVERWKRLSAPLALSAEQEAELITAINQLKEAIAVLLFTAPSEEQPSPGALLVQEQGAGNPEAIDRFAAYADEQMAPGLGVTYNGRMKQLNDETRAGLSEVLSEAQLEKLDQLPYVLLSDIPTGYDPFGDRMRAQMHGKTGE